MENLLESLLTISKIWKF